MQHRCKGTTLLPAAGGLALRCFYALVWQLNNTTIRQVQSMWADGFNRPRQGLFLEYLTKEYIPEVAVFSVGCTADS